MSSLQSLTEAHFSMLVQRLRHAGANVELHQIPGCGVLVVPSKRHIAISLEPPLVERYRMLCEAARRLHMTHLLEGDTFAAALSDTLAVDTRRVPWPRHGSTSSVPPLDDSLEISIDVSVELDLAHDTPRDVGPVSLGDALLDACGDTLRDDTRQVSRESLARHLAAARAELQPPPLPPRRATPSSPSPPVCELCTRPRYGALLDLELCRHHLYAAIQQRLLPGEVRLLRRHHGQHPELSTSIYDEDGEPRR